jgi:hypothetical protein
MKTLDVIMNITVTVPVPKGKTGREYREAIGERDDKFISKLIKSKSAKIRIYSIEDFDGSVDVKVNGKTVDEE